MTDTMEQSEDLSDWQVAGHFEVDGIKYGSHPFSREAIERIKSGDVPEFDVLVSTFPRSGTSRLVEICWLLMNDCDVQGAKNTDITQRHTFFELDLTPGTPTTPDASAVAKTHVDFKTAQKLVSLGKKIIHGIRNPKDALVSYYHFSRMNPTLGLFPGTWTQFFQLYMQGRFPYGDYFANVLSWWAEKDREQIMVVRYEDLNRNPLENIKKMAEFLGKKYSDEQMQVVAEWTGFSNMRVQSSTNFTSMFGQPSVTTGMNTYMRKGTVGGWKEYFSEDESRYIDEMCTRKCTPAGLTFQFC